MKRKYLTSTYLRDVDKYEIKLFLAEDDLYVSVKKLISVIPAKIHSVTL